MSNEHRTHYIDVDVEEHNRKLLAELGPRIRDWILKHPGKAVPLSKDPSGKLFWINRRFRRASARERRRSSREDEHGPKG